MKLKFFLLGAAIAAMGAGIVSYATAGAETEFKAPQRAVGTDRIPGSLPLKNWTYTGDARVEDKDPLNVGYVKNISTASIDVNCTETGVYEMSLRTKLYDGGNLNIKVTDLASGGIEINKNWTIADGDNAIYLDGLITEGEKNITFTITSSSTGFIMNYYEPTFTKVADTYDSDAVPEGWEVIPGEIPLTYWSYGGDARLENDNTNVGWVTNGSSASAQIFCTEAGVYDLDIDFYSFYNDCDFKITVTDDATDRKEIDYVYQITSAQHPKIVLPGLISKGRKSVRFDLSNTSGGFLVNWKVPTFSRIGDSFAKLDSFSVKDESIQANDMEGYDYAFTIPMDYSAATVDFTPTVQDATAVVTAEGAEVTDNGDGTYSIPTPALNGETVVKVALEAGEGAIKEKDEYTVRFFRIGGVILSGVNVDGFELDAEAIEALNNDAALTVADYIFTAVPEVNATFADGSQATAEVTVEGTVATCTFKGVAGDKEKSFTLTVDGVHLFTKADDDLTGTLRYNDTYKQANDVWSDGKFTLSPCGDGWGGTQFKLNAKGGKTFTLTFPGDMKIKQLTLASLGDNYQPGKVVSVASEGATAWLPSASTFGPKSAGYQDHDLVVNVENHVAGTPFEIYIESDGQPYVWFDYVYETVALTAAPELQKTSVTDLTGKNHAVVSFTFNTEIEATEVEFNGTTAASHVTGTTINFPLWDLEYETEYTLTLPAGSVKDLYGNVTDQDFSCTFTTGKQHDVTAIDAERFIAVETVEELLAAVAGLTTTNGTAASATTVIYIHNGDYDLGNGGHLDVNNVYNVSLIGQSQEGVLIHGTRTGITDAILSTRHSTNIYMENMTIRNDLDFGAENRIGVGVVHYGGNLDIMKNVTLQSIQDTQVTGERGYYYNCTIHGGVDYICGGGDHYYDKCTFVQECGGYITAPATSSAHKHGYVMIDCVVKGVEGYILGRPWHDEPRCYFINTVMESLPAPEGWSGMSDLPTHFYEYNSMDASGNVLDLSTRKNPATSTNSYTPVLTTEEAAYFTHRNVLGYTDSWDAQATVAECEAPTVKLTATGLEWNAIKGAAGYILYVDGKAAKFTTETGHQFSGPAAVKAYSDAQNEYKVAAVNANGAHGALSAAADSGTTGLETISAAVDTDAVFYNLNGQRVENPGTGIYIMRRGSEVSKVIIR